MPTTNLETKTLINMCRQWTWHVRLFAIDKLHLKFLLCQNLRIVWMFSLRIRTPNFAEAIEFSAHTFQTLHLQRQIVVLTYKWNGHELISSVLDKKVRKMYIIFQLPLCVSEGQYVVIVEDALVFWIMRESVVPANTLVSFAAVFRDVTQRSPERKFLSGERCVTSRKTAAKETTNTQATSRKQDFVWLWRSKRLKNQIFCFPPAMSFHDLGTEKFYFSASTRSGK